MSDAGNLSSEGRNETILRLLRSKLWKSLPRYHEGIHLSNDFKWKSDFFSMLRRKIMCDVVYSF
jgi:hypothetical protein